jgi:hypothetical protein
MKGQQLPSGSYVTEFRILLEALFAGAWVADKKRRGRP